MTKAEAIELLVNDKIEEVGYVPHDEYNEYNFHDLRACFILSITGTKYDSSALADIYEMVMRAKPVGPVDEKAKQSLIGFMVAKHNQGFRFLNRVKKENC